MNRKPFVNRAASIALLLATLIAPTFSPRSTSAQDVPTTPATTDGEFDASVQQPVADAWPGEYIVVLDPAAAGEVSAAQVQLAQSGELVDQVTACGSQVLMQVWRFGAPAAEMLQSLDNSTGIQSIEPNWIVRAASLPLPPPVLPEQPYSFDDTFYGPRQWNLQRSEFARAWQLVGEQGLATEKVRVAVIDSGVDFDHPDLAGQLLNGYNYIVTTTLPYDDFGHGTHVAGIIAAVADNGQGVVGGAPDVEIDPLKMLSSSGAGSIANLVRAICDAADRGADVINMSLEVPTSIGVSTAQQIQTAVDYAYGRGSILVAAAGNSNGGPVYYPARLNHVMAVAALTPELTRASYSAIGTQLDIAAGGGSFSNSVLSTWPEAVTGKCIGSGRILLADDGAYYCTEPGTSMSAPLVSAAAALLLAVLPDLTNDEVEAILEETSLDVGLSTTEAGAGLLNINAALRRILTSSGVAAPLSLGATVPPGTAPFTQTVVVSNPSLSPIDVAGSVVNSDWFEVISVAGSSFATTVVYGEPLYLTALFSPTQLAAGAYTNVIVLDLTHEGGGKSSLVLPVTLAIGDLNESVYLPIAGNVNAPKPQPTPTPISFTWETPIITPTLHSVEGSSWITVSLPFAFPLRGANQESTGSFNQVFVHADGFATFATGTPSVLPTPGTNQCLPVVSPAIQGAFGWWANLDPTIAGGELKTFLSAADRFVIEYDNIASAAEVTPPYRVSFQIVLRANGDIQYNYAETPQPIAEDIHELTPQVTVGVQARSGLFHNQATCITELNGFGRPPRSQESILFQSEDIY